MNRSDGDAQEPGPRAHEIVIRTDRPSEEAVALARQMAEEQGAALVIELPDREREPEAAESMVPGSGNGSGEPEDEPGNPSSNETSLESTMSYRIEREMNEAYKGQLIF
eukprot:s1227_g17.t1